MLVRPGEAAMVRGARAQQQPEKEHDGCQKKW
jgi:hypothetical protein